MENSDWIAVAVTAIAGLLALFATIVTTRSKGSASSGPKSEAQDPLPISLHLDILETVHETKHDVKNLLTKFDAVERYVRRRPNGPD